MKKIIILITLSFFSNWLFAQGNLIKVKGVVQNEEGHPMAGVAVSIDGSKEIVTGRDGKFSVSSSKSVSEVSEVKARKDGFELVTWAPNSKGELRLMMMHAPFLLKGQIVDTKGNILAGQKIKLAGLKFSNTARSNSKGHFSLELPHGTKITKSSVFLVNEKTITSNYFTYNPQNKRIVLKVLPDVAVGGKQEAEAPVEVIEREQIVRDGEVITDEDLKNLEIDPVLVVVVYDEDISPADSIEVRVDEIEYLTDSKGEFQIYADSINDSKFEVPDFMIIKKVYDYKDNYMFLHIQHVDPKEQKSEVHLEYDDNFQSVFNTLESQKQLLAEKGQDLRKEINKINEKLAKGAGEETQRKQLEAYLERLQNSLIENELEYQDAQYKTQEMLTRMKSQIVEKDEEIEDIVEKKELVEKELYLMVLVVIVAIIVVIFLVRLSKKLRKQKEDLIELTKNLNKAKKEVTKAHDEMLAVTEIGQRFTATLDFEQHMGELQNSVSVMVDAPIFGIGIYNEMEATIDFHNQINDGVTQNFYAESVDDENSFAAWAFRNGVELIVNDLDKEYHLYTDKSSFIISDHMPKSMIYMPLIVEAKAIGVITMQNPNKDAFKNVNVSNLKSLVSYAAIAVANHKAFRELKVKNKHITDGLRYAQTIQRSILPTEDLLKASLSDYFILYRSRDIVSGDFYWFSETMGKDGKLRKYVAVVDCTGHGVPGAFMSMIGNTLLNEIINIKKVVDPVEITNLLNEGVKITLRQEDDKINEDGMDMCLCVVEQGKGDDVKVSFTGAKRPLLYFKQNEGTLNVAHGDIKSIGSLHKSSKVFTRQDITLKTNDMLYLTSDGYVDQNNFEKEKIGSVRLMKVLQKIAKRSADYQLRELEDILDTHQGKVEQRDDITIFGLKL